ncbi:MAG: hypothetical protein JWM03_243 [Rhodocyclales bacterium]|nr:hypothetical protein [Rhodocyclales bacterium]MDB5887371.1 hypothetical protein [Rhodocyclales bacterium]
MNFLIQNLRRKVSRKDANYVNGPGMVSAILLDVRAYGFSSAVFALLRDLRD